MVFLIDKQTAKIIVLDGKVLLDLPPEYTAYALEECHWCYFSAQAWQIAQDIRREQERQ